jgi:hypothetical protein
VCTARYDRVKVQGKRLCPSADAKASEAVKKSTSIVILSPFAALRVNCAKDLHCFVFKDKDTADASLHSA